MTADQFANYLLNNGFGLLKEISKEQTPDEWRYWMKHFVNWLNSESEIDPKELATCTEWRTCINCKRAEKFDDNFIKCDGLIHVSMAQEMADGCLQYLPKE